MANDLISGILGPLVSAMQQFLDASFTILALFGFNAPRVNELVNSLFGLMV